jgi:hypothetical protein
MSLHATILTDLTAAMKARQSDRLAVLRMVKAALSNASIAAGTKELADDQVIKVLQSEAKKRKEAIAAFQQGNRPELAATEQAELAIIEQYLPPMASEDEIKTVVQDVMASGASDFGAVMGQVMQRLQGSADGQTVKRIVTEQTKATS